MPASSLDPSSLIEAIYDTADGTRPLNDVWQHVVGEFGAKTGCLYLETPAAAGADTTFLSMPGFSGDAIAEYGAYYVNVDPYAAHHRFREGIGSFLSQEVIAPETFRETEVWRDFSRSRIGAFHIMGAGFRLRDGRFVRAGIHRPPDAGCFEADDLRRYVALLPHLKRSLELGQTLHQLQALATETAAALQASAEGIILADGFGRVRFCNAAAERLQVAGHIGVGRSGGEIRLTSPEQNRRLRVLLADVARGAAGGVMTIRRKEGLKPILVSISRLPVPMREAARPDATGQGHLAIIVFREPGVAPPPDRARLEQLFGLTSAEADVAALLGSGTSVEDIATQRNRSISTIRTQVRHILAKTGAGSIRHLVALLARL
jgi:DNA-binding CsgD family transcriptional regulator